MNDNNYSTPNAENDGFQNPDQQPQDLDTQEQLNSENLSQRLEEENQANSDYRDKNETVDEASQGEEDLSGFLERILPDAEAVLPDPDRPRTKNLLGDNPPGAEQAAFDAGLSGDATSEQFKYDTNLAEGLRENIDKTQDQLDLDARLKKDGENLL